MMLLDYYIGIYFKISKRMNVLILTPDRVGSTLLQRLITVYMLRKGFDQTVVNLHELSNGLVKYFNEFLGQEMLGKPKDKSWGYWQSLPEVIDLLESVNHYKTSRLAHYHLLARQDSIADQLKFYQYLNENFYVISCRRQNLFEHALSWEIKGHSKHLNVYSPQQKIDVFDAIYRNKISVSKQSFEHYLNRYVAYTKWVETHFNVQSYFDYDHDMNNIESYILNLDFMSDCKNNSWKDMFGQDFESWNACHRMLPNLLLNPPAEATHEISFSTRIQSESRWNSLKGPDWPEKIQDFVPENLPVAIRNEITELMNIVTVPVSQDQHKFLSNNLSAYQQSQSTIQQLQEHGLLVTGVPIKLQSLHEKQNLIKNFDQSVEWYNNWATANGYELYSIDQLNKISIAEEEKLNSPVVQLLTNSVDKSSGCE
jgi:hypothetical protein